MDVVTKSGEVVNISEKQVYTFPNGLLGFENFKKFALIESEYEPFFWLQSLDEKNLAFLLIDPASCLLLSAILLKLFQMT
jgi:flagellar assembly factor FliW